MLSVELAGSAEAAAARLDVVTAADPLGYTLLATVHADVIAGARDHPDALWLVVRDDGTPVGAAMWTPPMPLYVGPMDPRAASLVADTVVDALTTAGLDPAAEVCGVNGDAEATRSAVRRWQERCPQVAVEGTTALRLHRLEDLVPPDVPGEARVATAADLDVVARWHHAFSAEIGHPEIGVEDGIRLRLERGALLVWTIAGELVSMAAHTSVVAGVARIGPVYTPPEQRGHGYGAAVTAATSMAALSQPGARDVALFSDLGNPTSNRIYAEIGYRPVRDYLEVTLSP